MEHPRDGRLGSPPGDARARGRSRRRICSMHLPAARTPSPRFGSTRDVAARRARRCSCVVVLWSAAWFYVPPIVAAQAEQAARASSAAVSRVGRVTFNPWTLELTIADLALAGAGRRRAAAARGPARLRRRRLRLAASPRAGDRPPRGRRADAARQPHRRRPLRHRRRAASGSPPRRRSSSRRASPSTTSSCAAAAPISSTGRWRRRIELRGLELGDSLHQLAAVGARDQGRAASRLRARRQPLRLGRRGDAVRRAGQRRAAPQARRLRRRARISAICRAACRRSCARRRSMPTSSSPSSSGRSSRSRSRAPSARRGIEVVDAAAHDLLKVGNVRCG